MNKTYQLFYDIDRIFNSVLLKYYKQSYTTRTQRAIHYTTNTNNNTNTIPSRKLQSTNTAETYTKDNTNTNTNINIHHIHPYMVIQLSTKKYNNIDTSYDRVSGSTTPIHEDINAVYICIYKMLYTYYECHRHEMLAIFESVWAEGFSNVQLPSTGATYSQQQQQQQQYGNNNTHADQPPTASSCRTGPASPFASYSLNSPPPPRSAPAVSQDIRATTLIASRRPKIQQPMPIIPFQPTLPSPVKESEERNLVEAACALYHASRQHKKRKHTFSAHRSPPDSESQNYDSNLFYISESNNTDDIDQEQPQQQQEKGECDSGVYKLPRLAVIASRDDSRLEIFDSLLADPALQQSDDEEEEDGGSYDQYDNSHDYVPYNPSAAPFFDTDQPPTQQELQSAYEYYIDGRQPDDGYSIGDQQIYQYQHQEGQQHEETYEDVNEAYSYDDTELLPVSSLSHQSSPLSDQHPQEPQTAYVDDIASSYAYTPREASYAYTPDERDVLAYGGDEWEQPSQAEEKAKEGDDDVYEHGNYPHPHPDQDFTAQHQTEQASALYFLRDLFDSSHQPPSSSTLQGTLRLYKSTLQHATVIGQIDKKFVLIYLPEERLLVALDPHAADERCRLETFYNNNCICENICIQCYKTSSDIRGDGEGCVKVWFPPVSQTISRVEQQLLIDHEEIVKKWGFAYTITCTTNDTNPATSISHTTIIVQSHASTSLPIESYSGDYTIILHQSLIILGEALTLGDLFEYLIWLGENPSLPYFLLKPPAITRILAYKACRSAIMFGTALTIQQCYELLYELAKTKLSFQCAHGRPTLYPLLNIHHSSVLTENPPTYNSGTVSDMGQNYDQCDMKAVLSVFD